MYLDPGAVECCGASYCVGTPYFQDVRDLTAPGDDFSDWGSWGAKITCIEDRHDLKGTAYSLEGTTARIVAVTCRSSTAPWSHNVGTEVPGSAQFTDVDAVVGSYPHDEDAEGWPSLEPMTFYAGWIIEVADARVVEPPFRRLP